MTRFECFHNGIILIVNCFELVQIYKKMKYEKSIGS